MEPSLPCPEIQRGTSAVVPRTLQSFPTILSQAISPGEGQGVTHSLLPSGRSPAYKLPTHWVGCPDHRWEILHCPCAKDAHGGGKRDWYS